MGRRRHVCDELVEYCSTGECQWREHVWDGKSAYGKSRYDSRCFTPVRTRISADVPQVDHLFAIEPLDKGDESLALDLPNWQNQCLHPRRGNRQKTVGSHRPKVMPITLSGSRLVGCSLGHVDRLGTYCSWCQCSLAMRRNNALMDVKQNLRYFAQKCPDFGLFKCQCLLVAAAAGAL